MKQTALGQKKNISGQLIDKRTGAAIDQTLITNIQSKQYTLSDKQGVFSILVCIGDTLRFSKVGYKTFVQVITNIKPMHIELEDNIIVLDEVNITAKGLTSQQTLMLRKKEYQTIYLKGDKSRIVQIAPLGIAISINRLFSALSKEGKDARRLQRTFVKDYENSIVDQRFSKELVGRITGLKGKLLDDFIMQHRPSYEWIVKATDYDIITYIKERVD